MKNKIRTPLAGQKLAVLATSNADQPHCSLIVFMIDQDQSELLFITDRHSLKYSNLSRNPKVSLLIDTRPAADRSFNNAVAVTLVGEAEEIVGDRRGVLLDRFIEQHHGMRRFAEDPNQALIKVRIIQSTSNTFPGNE
jgi:nitroimidazol reductase NimA-like FMN-containing flavoprotein (pyridoxamine 5'-phosphate oxidase superfamily)